MPISRHHSKKAEDVDRVEEQSEYNSLRVLKGEMSAEEYVREINRKKDRHLDLRQLAAEFMIAKKTSHPSSR